MQEYELPKPLVIVEERAADALARGCRDLADLLALTLSPTQGFVLNHREHMGPEVHKPRSRHRQDAGRVASSHGRRPRD